MTDPMTARPADGGEAGYATLARLLTAYYAISPPLGNRQVHQWHRRRTKNKLGEPFPEPVRETVNPRRGQPRYLFGVRAVLNWYAAGVPEQHGQGWRVPFPVVDRALPLMERAMTEFREGNESAP